MVDIGGTQRRGRTTVRSTEVAITLTLRAQRRISTFGETEVEIPSNARYTKSRREVRPSDIKLDTCRPMEEPKEGCMAVGQHFADSRLGVVKGKDYTNSRYAK
jgi:hypothetical protein